MPARYDSTVSVPHRSRQEARTACWRWIDARILTALGAAAAGTAQRSRKGRRAAPGHALSLYGDVKYPPGFTHVDYVNPDAPKGGFVRFGDLGTFDNLNPFILKGVSFVRFANSS